MSVSIYCQVLVYFNSSDAETFIIGIILVQTYYRPLFGIINHFLQRGECSIITISKDFNIHEVCDQVRANMNYSQRLQLFQFLVSLGACDGLIQSEVNTLEAIAASLRLSKGDSDSIFAIYRPNNDSNYRILEIDPSASNEEVKKAYRKMAVKYHPDKVATLGEDVQKAAEVKFKAVAQAYEAICKERGI
mgnify:CR=1 FL=1